jgi:hypothetical protein
MQTPISARCLVFCIQSGNEFAISGQIALDCDMPEFSNALMVCLLHTVASCLFKVCQHFTANKLNKLSNHSKQTTMKKMLQITSAALLVSFISFPSNLFAQSLSNNQEGFAISERAMGIAGIALVLGLAIVFSVLESKKGVNEVQ